MVRSDRFNVIKIHWSRYRGRREEGKHELRERGGEEEKSNLEGEERAFKINFLTAKMEKTHRFLSFFKLLFIAKRWLEVNARKLKGGREGFYL